MAKKKASRSARLALSGWFSLPEVYNNLFWDVKFNASNVVFKNFYRVGWGVSFFEHFGELLPRESSDRWQAVFF